MNIEGMNFVTSGAATGIGAGTAELAASRGAPDVLGMEAQA